MALPLGITGHFEVFLDAKAMALGDARPEDAKPRRLRERGLPCADHAAFRSRSAMPGRQRLAAATRFRRRRPPTAANPNPRRSTHVRSASQRPYGQEKEGGANRRCRRLGRGRAGCLHGPERRRFRKPGPGSVARCPQADSGPGERPAGCDDLAREGRPDGPAARRQLDRAVWLMRQPGLGPAEPELHEDVARRQQHGVAARGRYGQPAGYDRPGRDR